MSNPLNTLRKGKRPPLTLPEMAPSPSSRRTPNSSQLGVHHGDVATTGRASVAGGLVDDAPMASSSLNNNNNNNNKPKCLNPFGKIPFIEQHQHQQSSQGNWTPLPQSEHLIKNVFK